MPRVFLSPSTQEFNPYATSGNEEYYMNLLADRLEPYLTASGISFTRNDPSRGAAGAIYDSNSGYYDVHLALHSNASPPNLAGQLRGIDIYYAPSSYESERLATIMANNFKEIYPLPDRSNALPTTTLGEVTRTRAVAVLAELGYHDNLEDESWLTSNLDRIAENIAISLTDYFGIPFVSPTAARQGIVQTDGSGLNFRGYPSLYGTVIGSIPDRTALTIFGQTGDWYVTEYNGQRGYVNAAFVELLS